MTVKIETRAGATTKAARPTVRGFTAPCPKCGEYEVRVSLADVSELHCAACEEDIDLANVREVVRAWGPVIAWLDTAPVVDNG